MKIVGIICEMNPPHLGHKLLFDFARETPGDCAVIAVMSGNYVQRGEAAVFAKHPRAAATLRCGADLVIELPTPYAVSSAEGFARSAVSLLLAAGIDTLAFGSECGDVNALEAAAQALGTAECEALTRSRLHDGVSYARARQGALTELVGEGARVLESPNNLLGIEYIRAVRAAEARLGFVCMKRETGITASGLRRAIQSGGDTAQLLPSGALPYGAAVFPEMLELSALSRLRMLPDAAFFKTPGGADGIAERSIKICREGTGLSEIAQSIKTKRHTLSRVRRYLLSLTLGITDDLPPLPPYIRVLGTNACGRELLRRMNGALPVITKPADAHRLGGEAERVFELEARATDFYMLVQPEPNARRGGAEWRTSPVTI